MNKYFLQRISQLSTSKVSSSQIESYRELVIIEMQRMGATDYEISLIHEATILNSIKNNRRPEDVAWAILQ